MTEDEKRMLEEDFKKAGSVPALLEAMARSETKEFRDLRRQVEEGPDHPTGDELYDYVLGWLDKEESLLVMDHLLLCGTCLREVFKIRSIEEALTEDALARADRLPWWERVKSFISKLSFPVYVHAPALEPVRRTTTEPLERRYKPGTELVIYVEAPADGYVAIFHACEESQEVELVFPLDPTDNFRLDAGVNTYLIEGVVTEPIGMHSFVAFWTRVLLLDTSETDLQDKAVREEMVERFFDAIEDMDENDWRSTTTEYEVVVE